MENDAAQQWVPAPWFLVTAPEAKADTTVRSRLIDVLDTAIASHEFTIVEAPSGFGKTTSLAQWAAHRRQEVAWLSLTHHDDTPAQLLSGVLTAVRRVAQAIDPELAARLRPILPDPGDPARTVEQILDALARRETPVVLVIDDAQLTGDDAVARVLVPLVEHSGGSLRLVVSGTGAVGRWFTRQLMDGRARRVGAPDLAFTADEIKLAMVAPDTDQPGASEILQTTLGWPVAVRLALRDPQSSLAPVRGNLQENDSLLTDYIEAFVLGSLSPELRAFVLTVTTCDRLSAELGEVLSGRSDSSSLLQECVRQGLFLDQFVQENSATVYHWHSTFARHCRIIANRQAPEQTRRTHAAAAQWLAARFPSEAIVHALHAGEPAMATTLIIDHWQRMLIDGNGQILETTCLRLGDPWNSSAEILLIRACCHDIRGDRTGAALLQAKAAALGIEDSSTPAGQRLVLTRAYANLFIAHDQAVLTSAADTVAQSLTGTAVRPTTQAYRTFLLGWTELRLRRNPTYAVQLLQTAIREARDVGYDMLAHRASMNLMFALAHGGQLTAARAVFLQSQQDPAHDDREWEHYDGGIDLMAYAHVDYWQDDLHSTVAHCRTLINSGGHSSSYSALGRVYFALAGAALRDPQLISQAHSYLNQVSDSVAHGVPWHAYKALGRAYLAFASGDSDAALAAAAPLRDESTIPMTAVLLADMYRRLGQPALAVRMLRGIRQQEKVSTVMTSALVTTAAIAWQQGHGATAHRNLERALDVAVSEKIVRPFAQLDDPLRELMTEHAAWGSSHEGFLAARLSSGEAGISRREILASPLSAREREVFGYLCTTLTAEEIASKLFVSVNTIRTHQRAIYRKLGVNNRRDAIRFQL